MKQLFEKYNEIQQAADEANWEVQGDKHIFWNGEFQMTKEEADVQLAGFQKQKLELEQLFYYHFTINVRAGKDYQTVGFKAWLQSELDKLD